MKCGSQIGIVIRILIYAMLKIYMSSYESFNTLWSVPYKILFLTFIRSFFSLGNTVLNECVTKMAQFQEVARILILAGASVHIWWV
jgi:hypothetical protein